VTRQTAFAACLLDECGRVSSLFNLTGPLEALALPLDNAALRTLHGLCATLAQVVQLRAAVASMTVRGTAIKMLRIVILGFGTARQKMALE
jgi:hypothetical protein